MGDITLPNVGTHQWKVLHAIVSWKDDRVHDGVTGIMLNYFVCLRYSARVWELIHEYNIPINSDYYHYTDAAGEKRRIAHYWVDDKEPYLDAMQEKWYVGEMVCGK